jgi:hypothetical protein
LENFLWANQAARIIIAVTIIELMVLVSKGLRNCCSTIMLTTVVNMMAAKPPIPMMIRIGFRAWGLAGEVDDIRLTTNC